jgi:hypothetical protein
MIKFCLAAGTALTVMTGVALGQPSSSIATGSPVSVASKPGTVDGNGIVGQFWSSPGVQLPASIGDISKSVQFAGPVSETASR